MFVVPSGVTSAKWPSPVLNINYVASIFFKLIVFFSHSDISSAPGGVLEKGLAKK
jgi:hypothetical protein